MHSCRVCRDWRFKRTYRVCSIKMEIEGAKRKFPKPTPRKFSIEDQPVITKKWWSVGKRNSSIGYSFSDYSSIHTLGHLVGIRRVWTRSWKHTNWTRTEILQRHSQAKVTLPISIDDWGWRLIVGLLDDSLDVSSPTLKATHTVSPPM